MISLKWSEFIRDGYVRDKFDNLASQLRALFEVSHNEDGTLRDLDLTLANSIPIGSLMPFAGPTAPAGWRICDGSAVSRVTLKRLFETIGTAWGAGDGSTTFNLPDLRQKFLLGKAASGTGATLGSTGGAIDHAHTGPSHTHSISSDGAHTHSISADGTHQHTIGAHSHSIAGSGTLSTGAPIGDSSTSFSYQSGAIPAQFVNGPSSHTHEIGSHNHGGATDTTDLTTAENGSHSHGGATGSNGAHTHGGATGAGGTGNTGTANPPFAVVNYLIFAGV
jgi:microcystin-dependent protein